ncbi:MAG TPA: phosphatidylglycerol lysyltransferase domain-containing protein, partial [Mycobacterium sp.]|nr:phosphatidylglycerol lysyltransferase domain-containing protein [Mycobacterium sp.]
MTTTLLRSGSRLTSRYQWVPGLAGWIVGIAATLSLLASLSPLIRWIIKVPREFIDNYLFNFPDTSVAWAFVLALLAAALSARKRIAWWLLLANLLVAAGWNAARLVTSHGDALQTVSGSVGLVLHAAAILLLLLAYREFWAKVRRGALLRSAAALLAGWAVAILASWALIEMFPGSLERRLRLPYVVNRVVGFALVGPDFFAGRPDVVLNALFGLLGALALIIAAVVLFLSQRAENALTGQDESAIRGLLALYGQNDSLGYFATRRDKSVVFAPNGRAAITYRVEVGVCLASGDPVGDPRAWPQAISAWLRLCKIYGWAPGVMGAS